MWATVYKDPGLDGRIYLMRQETASIAERIRTHLYHSYCLDADAMQSIIDHSDDFETEAQYKHLIDHIETKSTISTLSSVSAEEKILLQFDKECDDKAYPMIKECQEVYRRIESEQSTFGYIVGTLSVSNAPKIVYACCESQLIVTSSTVATGWYGNCLPLLR